MSRVAERGSACRAEWGKGQESIVKERVKGRVGQSCGERGRAIRPGRGARAADTSSSEAAGRCNHLHPCVTLLALTLRGKAVQMTKAPAGRPPPCAAAAVATKPYRCEAGVDATVKRRDTRCELGSLKANSTTPMDDAGGCAV